MGAARQAKLDRNRFSDVGQARSDSDRAWARPGAKGQNRNMLARVIKAAKSRIVAVVGGDDAIVSRPHRRFDGAKPSIKSFETGRIARDVTAMSPFGVKIDQIDEDQAALRRCPKRIDEKVDIAVVALALALVPGVAVGEDVANLSNRDNCAAAAGGPLQNIALRRRHGEILAVGGAREVLAARAEERTRDHAPDLERIAEPAHDPAKIIKALKPESLLMRRNLEHRVGGRVTDGFQRSQVLFAVLLDHCGARSVAGGENPRQPSVGDQRLGQRRRKSGNRLREITPIEVDRRTGELPMARRRVLAAGSLDSVAPLAARLRKRKAGRSAAGRRLHRVAKPQRLKPRQFQRSSPQSVAVAASVSTGFGGVAQRIRALIAISFCILRAAATDRIENNEKRAGHRSPLLRERGRGGGFAPEPDAALSARSP